MILCIRIDAHYLKLVLRSIRLLSFIFSLYLFTYLSCHYLMCEISLTREAVLIPPLLNLYHHCWSGYYLMWEISLPRVAVLIPPLLNLYHHCWSSLATLSWVWSPTPTSKSYTTKNQLLFI